MEILPLLEAAASNEAAAAPSGFNLIAALVIAQLNVL
jgi:hypothetical protein